MSRSVINAVRVMDPRMAQSHSRTAAVVSGPSQVTIYRDNSTNASNSQISHNITPPTPIVIDRKVYLEWTFDFTFTCSDTGVNCLSIGTADAIRYLPISQAISTCSVTINGQQVSMQMADLMSALGRYINLKEQNTWSSSTGAMPDQFTDYHDYVTVGSNRNPLGLFGDTSSQPPRGSLNYNVISNTHTAAHVQVQCREPLLISPFIHGAANAPGFYGVQNMNFQFTLGDLKTLWSHDNAQKVITIASASVVASGQTYPTLALTYLSPDYALTPFDLSKPQVYSYFDIPGSYSAAGGSLSAGASTTTSSGTITLSSIPSRFYVFARRVNTDRSMITTDTFAQINTVSITWDNRNGLLASALSTDLYTMSVKNGLQDSFPAWAQYSGSVLCVEMGSDIGLLDGQAPGMAGQFQLNVQCNYTNISAASINYQLYVVPILPGAFIIEGNLASKLTGIVTKADVDRAKESPFVDFSQISDQELFAGAGSFWGSLKDFGRNLFQGVKRFVPHVLGQLDKLEQGDIKGALRGVAQSAAQDLLGSGAYWEYEQHKRGPLNRVPHPIGGAVIGGGLITAGKMPKGSKKSKKAKGGLLLGGCDECGMCSQNAQIMRH